MDKVESLKKLLAKSKQIARADAARSRLMAERDDLMRQAKSMGATWEDLQSAAGMNSPTAVSRALKRQP